MLVLSLSLSLFMNTATAFWVVGGSGAGEAAAATVTAPEVTATLAGVDDVTVTWTEPTLPSGAVLSGYYVLRDDGTDEVAVCDSDVDDLLPSTPRTCVDEGVAPGTYTYRVVAVLASWSTASAPSNDVVVAPPVDTTSPNLVLTTTATTRAYAGEFAGQYRLYYDGDTGGGSFRLLATVTDTESGPASATFPALSSFGWAARPSETITSGSGSAPTIDYTSSPFAWTFFGSFLPPGSVNISASDVAGNVTTRSLVFVRDTTAPSGGVLQVNGVAGNATGAGAAQTDQTSGTVTINALTRYTESQSATASGLEESELTRAFAPLAAGSCGSYGAPSVIGGAAPIVQTDLASGCYRYRLNGVDRVGNEAADIVRVVRIDRTAPQAGALTANSVAASAAGTTSNAPGAAWTLTRTDWTDPESGLTVPSTLTRQQAPFTSSGCGAFGASTTIVGTPAQTGTLGNCYRYTLSATNGFGEVSTISTTVVVAVITSVEGINGSAIAGRLQAGDQLVITYVEPIDPSSMCSTWGSSGDQSLTADNQVTVVLSNNVSGSDRLSVTSSACTFNFGSLALGSNGYATGNRTFGGAGAGRSTVAWDESARTLTIVLGTPSGTTATVASSTMTYTPSTSVDLVSGVSLGGTFATPNQQHF